MNDELCNPVLWAAPSATNGGAAAPAQLSVPAGDNSSEISSHPLDAYGSGAGPGGLGGAGGGALDEARLRYKSAVAALRAVISAIPCSSQLIYLRIYLRMGDGGRHDHRWTSARPGVGIHKRKMVFENERGQVRKKRLGKLFLT